MSSVTFLSCKSIRKSESSEIISLCSYTRNKSLPSYLAEHYIEEAEVFFPTNNKLVIEDLNSNG